MNTLTQNIPVLILAFALDRFLPEPPNRLHPVAWMGWAIDSLRRLAPTAPMAALLFGAVLALIAVGGSALAAHLVVDALRNVGEAAYVLGGALVLRSTFTVRGLPEHIRISIRLREECKKLVEALGEEMARGR